MWRRVASQSPSVAGGQQDAYIKAFTALGKMLRDGRSLSGHERNCCFLNTQDNRFATISAASGLDFADDGRAIGLSDWDHDGDVDVWLANRTGPRLRFMRNETVGANFVTFKLLGTTCNRDAIGARLELYLSSAESNRDSNAKKLIRTIHAGRGFMSQASKRIHFGVGDDLIERLVVRWPDGEVEEFTRIFPGQHYDVTQGSGRAEVWTRPVKETVLKSSQQTGMPVSNRSRIVVTGRLPMPKFESTPIQNGTKPVAVGATLINLWSTNCLPCIKELTEFSLNESELRQAGVNILALNVDELMEDARSDLSRSKQILDEVKFPFAAAAINADDSGTLDLFHQAFLSLRRPLPVPSSFLTTADGRVAVIYRGPIGVPQILNDIKLLQADTRAIRDEAVPFSGRWHAKPIGPNPKRHATAFLRNGFASQGAKYLEMYLLAHLNKKGWGPQESWPSGKLLAELCDVLANFYRLQDEPKKIMSVYRIALGFDPKFVPSFMNLGKALIGQGKINEGLQMLERANRLSPSDPIVASDLAIAYAMTGRLKPAEQLFLRLLKVSPETPGIHLNLARLYFRQSRFKEAAPHFDSHLRLQPDSIEALRSSAWIFISSSNDRDPQRAKEILGRLQAIPEVPKSLMHDLTAALFAEQGDFKRAVEEARRAVDFAAKEKSPSATEIERRLQLYLDKQGFRLR